eukprot:gene29700-16116_t
MYCGSRKAASCSVVRGRGGAHGDAWALSREARCSSAPVCCSARTMLGAIGAAATPHLLLGTRATSRFDARPTDDVDVCGGTAPPQQR